jgi:integrase
MPASSILTLWECGGFCCVVVISKEPHRFAVQLWKGAVGHGAIARRTRRCAPVTQAEWVTSKRSPCLRTMSATSRRVAASPLAEPARAAHRVGSRDRHGLQRIRDGLQMPLRGATRWGCRAKVIAQLMGHAKVDTTLNVYTQVMDGALRKAAELVGSELFTIVHKSEGASEPVH